jgi:hypothetical protein
VTAARDRRPVLAGSVLANGLYFPAGAAAGALDGDEIERRLVASWQPGARLWECDGGGVLLEWPAPRRVRAERAPGQPVRRSGGGFRAAPETLLGREAAGGELLMIVGGAPCARALRACEVADWVTLPPALRLTVAPLVEAAAAREPQGLAPAAEAARALLSVAPPDPGRAAVLAALDGKTAPEAAGATGPARPHAARRRLLDILRFLFRRQGGARARAEPLAPTPPRGLLARLAELASRWLMRGRLGQLLGRRQAEYLAYTMALLERGDLDEGLRRAIPLGTMKDAAAARRPALGLPTVRATLAITLARPSAGGGSYTLEDTFFARMERLYRATFERLDAQGRKEEAAFVLAELLRADEEAVAYLERKGELRLAAELAEARRVGPGLVVRQWFLAGDARRAIAYARRHRAFADAVVRLERSDPARAIALRMIWADSLVEAGRRLAAVDVVWRIPTMSQLIRRWIDAGLAEPGPEWPALLARRIALPDTSWDDVRPHLGTVLAGDEADDARLRLNLASELARASSPCAATAERLLLRRLYADHARRLVHLDDATAAELARASADPALVADRPRPRDRREAPLRVAIEPVEIEAGPRGSVPVHDAVPLSTRRILVALGEVGVRLVDAQGRALAHFDEPAHRLVRADTGDRVLLLAPREPSVQRLGRLDLGRRMAASWCEVRLMQHASSFDGDVWFVATGDAVLAIDTHAPGLVAFWSVPLDPDTGVVALARDANRLALLTGGWGPTTSWSYALPEHTLRARNVLERLDASPRTEGGPPLFIVSNAVSPTGPAAELVLDVGAGELMLRWHRRTCTEARVPMLAGASAFRLLEHDGSWIACIQVSADAARVSVFDAEMLRERLRVHLPEATEASARFHEGRLVITDSCGRLLLVDLADGRVARALRF